VIARPRLARRLSAASRGALTLLAAPAGFGKTTVLTEWLATLPPGAPAVAWLSLDRRDNDPALFWAYVVTAVQAATATATEGVGSQAWRMLASSSPSTEAAVAALLNDLGALPEDLLLLLDDYHLIETPEVHEQITFLLEHQPPQLHVLIATRTDPPLPLARMRAGGQLGELRATDLRFTVEESAAYLNGPMGLRLGKGDLAVLDARTEGWIAALQLAALSMQGRDDVAAFIAGFAGDDHYVVDYLGEEVLSRQSAETRDFLLRTSVLERLTGPLCDAVTAGAGGRAALLALERANLFLVPLDDRRQWYRYHRLFADVLHAHLLDEHAEEVPELHRRASAWFAANGDVPQAIEHVLMSGDWGRAADLMESAVPAMARERREGELARWVRSLPADVVRRRPVLGVAFAGALTLVSDLGTVGQRLAEVERSLRAPDGTWPEQPPPGLIVVDDEGFRLLPGRIAMYRAALALGQGDLGETVMQAQQALALAPPDDDLTRASAGALGGLAAWTGGELGAAHAAFTQTVTGLARVGFVADVLGCCITLGDIRRIQGRLDEALRTYQDALELAPAAPGGEPLRGSADLHVGMAGVLVERDDLTAAEEHLAVSRRLGEGNGLPQNAYRWRVVTARLREAQGDLDGALELLDEAVRVYVGDYLPNVRPVPAVRARLRLRRGELSHAEAWSRDHRLSAGDEPSYLREYEHLTLARVLLARHRAERDTTVFEEAIDLLGRLLAAAEDGERGASVIEILLLQALAQQARGDTPAAVRVLHRAVSLARPEGFVRLFADEGPAMADLLKALARQSRPSGYVRRLIVATTRVHDGPVPQTGLVDPLSDRELQVLRLLATDLDGPDIARALSVSLNTMRTHTKNIYTKLGVTNRRAAVRQAQDLHLLSGQRRS
jgi:LuxR family maltose regulon positive regulatory protein